MDAIGKEVLPAYLRFARFLEASYVPAGRAKPGHRAPCPTGRSTTVSWSERTTTDLTPQQIHQIGLDEVGKDEAEMLAIAEKLGFKDLASFRASSEGQSQDARGLGRCAAGRVSRLSEADAGQAAGAVRPLAQGAVRGGRGSRLR